MVWIDHLGNTFKSAKALCSYHGIPCGVFDHRMRQGWSIEQALTVKPSRFCKDHLGNSYTTKSDMCKAYGISMTTFSNRINKGMSIEEALTTPVIVSNDKVTNCLGVSFKSRSEMFKFYNITSELFKKRMKKGWSELETLGVIPRLSKTLTDTFLFDNYVILKYVDSDYYECLINNQSIIKSRDLILLDCLNYYKNNTEI